MAAKELLRQRTRDCQRQAADLRSRTDWTAEPGWQTELQLKNNLSHAALTVTPVLRLPDGREIPLHPVTIPSQSVRSVDVATELAQVAPAIAAQQELWGSVAFRFNSPGQRNLYAAVMVHMHEQPIGYHVDAWTAQATSGKAGSREGIWWMPHPGAKDFLILSNGSDRRISGFLYLSDADGRQWKEPLPLAAHEAKRLVVSQLVQAAGFTSGYGGIKYEVPSYADAVDSIHFVYDDTVGFSAMMKMFDRDPNAKLAERMWSGNTRWAMWAPMLALESPDPAVGFPAGTLLEPYIFLYNTTGHTIQADLALNWRGQSARGRVALPRLTLRPPETRRLQIAALEKPLGIPDDAHWALVKLTGSAAPDEFIAVAASYDHTGRYGAQTPFSDQLSGHWVGGQWLVDATHNTIVAVGNGGDKPTDALLTIHFNDGRDTHEIQQTIAPGQQMWLNFADLIHNQVPDRNGKLLPAALTSGTYDLKDLTSGTGGSLFEGKVILDKTWGHLAYGCLECCVPQGIGLLSDPTFVGVGGTSPLDAWGDDSCTGDPINLDGYFRNGTWWSGNTGIATVGITHTTGVSVGGTTGFARANVPSQAPRYCPMQPQQAAAPVNVKPGVHLSGVADIPLRGSGSSGPNSASFSATGSPAGGTFTWSTPSGNISLSSTSGAMITVTAKQASGSQGGEPVTVVYKDAHGNASDPATVNVVIQKPTSLGLTADTTNTSGHTCDSSADPNNPSCVVSSFSGSGSYSSYLRQRQYSVMDQFGAKITGYALQLQESFSGLGGSCSSGKVNTASGTGDTVTDCFYFCSNTCRLGGSCSNYGTQTITVNGFQVAVYSISWSCTGVTIQ